VEIWIDVKVEGDRATGTLRTKTSKPLPLPFVKIDGSWYLGG
jgi:hypothetical protein